MKFTTEVFRGRFYIPLKSCKTALILGFHHLALAILTSLMFSVSTVVALAAPTTTQNATQTIYKFPSVMDVGLPNGATWGSVGKPMPTESEIPLGYHHNSYGAISERSFFYFDDIQSYLDGASYNQIVSANLVIFWSFSSEVCKNTYLQIAGMESAWSEGSIATQLGTSSQNFVKTFPLDIDLKPPSSRFDVRSSLTSAPNYAPNYGYELRRPRGPLCQSDGTRVFTREASPNVRPYLEIVVDTSRPKYPAPTDSPQGFALIAAIGSVSATWSSTQANTESVRVDINCSQSGSFSVTVSAASKIVSRRSLKAGEKCTARSASITDGGSSPLSMSTLEVIVAGTAPSAAPTSKLSIASGQALVSITGIPSDATELLITLTCTQSGQRTTTVTASQASATFTGLTTGEICSSYAVASNPWGSSPQGSFSTSELVRGQAPSAMSFFSESLAANQLRIIWSSTPANTNTVDLTLVCQSTGQITRSIAPSDRQAIISNLKPGEQCTPTLSLTNQWGSSVSTTNLAVTIRGLAPSSPTISNIDLSIAQQVVVAFTAPTGATSIDLFLRCSQAGNSSLLAIPISRTSATFTNAIAGDRCNVLGQAKNEWGASTNSAATNQFIIQGALPDSPSDLSINSDVEKVRVDWTNGSGALQTQVTLECSRSGTRTFTISTPNRTQMVSSIGGELCTAILVSLNQWGESKSSLKSSSIQVQSKPTSAQGETTVTLPKNTTPTKPSTTKPSTTEKTSGITSGKYLIVCIKGSAQKIVTALKPKCPTGWIKRPEVTKKN